MCTIHHHSNLIQILGFWWLLMSTVSSQKTILSLSLLSSPLLFICGYKANTQTVVTSKQRTPTTQTNKNTRKKSYLFSISRRRRTKREMKLVWCPDAASKAYIDTVKSCEIFEESSAAEVVSAMAGGWKPELIVETWYQGGVITTSVGLAIASRHTCGRHVCIVPDNQSRSEYIEGVSKTCGISPEVIVGDVEQVMEGLVGIDFLVVDCRRKDFIRILRIAKLSHRGAVLVCKNSNPKAHSTFRWRSVVDSGSRIVRSAYLPVGKGVEIAYVATSGGSSSSSGKDKSRWVRHIDEVSGEEHVYRR